MKQLCLQVMLHCMLTICYHASTAVCEAEVQTEKSFVVEISLQTDDLLDSIVSPVQEVEIQQL